MNLLPNNNGLNISALSRTFDNTATSYKYLFFLSILSRLNTVYDKDNIVDDYEISFIELATEMLLYGWFPHHYFKLSLGKLDQCSNILNRYLLSEQQIIKNPVTPLKIDHLRINLKNWLKENPSEVKDLVRFVPYRLLAPFYKNELRGVEEGRKNYRIIELSIDGYSHNRSPYKITSERIVMNSRWVKYFIDNFLIIDGWVKWKWCEYLQRRNPSVPAIANKLFPALKRVSMNSETEYWRELLKMGEFRCIYSDKVLDKFALDHFLPWAFVTHNQLWNLMPVDRGANSSKSNRLPDLDKYMDRFVNNQIVSIQMSKDILPEIKWRKHMDSYISDLSICNYDDLFDENILRDAYRNTINPLYTIAERNGFESGWVLNEI